MGVELSNDIPELMEQMYRVSDGYFRRHSQSLPREPL